MNMKTRRLPRLHLHEVLFGGFLVITALRLISAGAWTMGLAFAGMAVTMVTAALGENQWQTIGMMRLRLLVLPVVMNVSYCMLGLVMDRLGMDRCDASLLRIDRSLFGETPSVLCNAWIHPWSTDVLSGCYLFFLPAVLSVFVAAQLWPGAWCSSLFDGLFSVYALGFLGYTLVPAAGPHLVMPDAFAVPLEGGFLTKMNATIVGGGSNHVDVFPSLHTAVTLFLMGWLWWHKKELFLALLVPAAGILISTIYLRYHYGIDVAAGLGLAVVGLSLSHTNQRQP